MTDEGTTAEVPIERPSISYARLFRRVRSVVPLLFSALFTFYFLLPVVAYAQVDPGLAEFGRVTTLAQDDLRVIVARIIRTFLGLLGVVAVLIVLYGGFLWMTAKGEADKIESAKKVLVNGAIGLVLVLSAFSIAQFVLSRLLAATGDSGGGAGGASGIVFPATLTGALGAGPIIAHHPERDASGVPPNTRIFVTFRDKILAESLIADTNGNRKYGTTGTCTNPSEASSTCDNNFDLALPEAVQVARVGVNVDWTKLTPAMKTSNPEAFAEEAAKLVPVSATMSADRKTVAVTPIATEGEGATMHVAETANGSGIARRQNLAGTPADPVSYIVRLTPSITDDTGRDAIFSGAWRDGYAWAFTVSAVADTTPPTIESVIPLPTATEARNVLLQVHFNEAMDPTVTSGVHQPAENATFHFLGVEDAATLERVAGEWTLGNGYRTTEFQTFDACGINSCGGPVYCLPGLASLRTFVAAAPLENPSATDTHYGLPFSGVMDAAGNSLSGDGDGDAEGPGATGAQRFDLATKQDNGASDSAEWTFNTSSTIDLTPPAIDEIAHYRRGAYTNIQEVREEYDDGAPLSTTANLPDVENVALDLPFEARFTKPMSVTTTAAFSLEDVSADATGCDPTTGMGCMWFTARLAHEPDGNLDGRPDGSRVIVRHGTLRGPSPAGAAPQYRVRVDAGARDMYQNCFFATSDPRGPQGVRGGERCIGDAASATCAEIQ